MSSYKGHTIFALVLALMFFNNPLIIALSVIGANIPDFDHKFKKDNVYKMIILGLIVFISLYILKLPQRVGEPFAAEIIVPYKNCRQTQRKGERAAGVIEFA